MPGPGSQNGRARPPKSENIHGLVRAGDVAAVQRKLQENPALLNDKNPVVRALPVTCVPSFLAFLQLQTHDLCSFLAFLTHALWIEHTRFVRKVASGGVNMWF